MNSLQAESVEIIRRVPTIQTMPGVFSRTVKRLIDAPVHQGYSA